METESDSLIDIVHSILLEFFQGGARLRDYQPPPPPPPPPPPEDPPPPPPEDEPGGETDELIELPRPLERLAVFPLMSKLFHEPLYQLGL